MDVHRNRCRHIALLTSLLLCACQNVTWDSEMIRVGTVEWARGVDSPQEPWTGSEFWQVPTATHQVWIRAETVVEPQHLVPGRPMGVRLAVLASCEVRWDGHLLAAEGRPAVHAAAEIAGPTSQALYVPDHLATLGSHHLELRCSNHHRGFEPSAGYWLLAVGDYERVLRGEQVMSWTAMASLSGMLIIGSFYLLLFVLDRRRRPYLSLALLALSGAGLLVAETWRNLVGYTYDWHIVRLRIVTALAWLVAFFLLGFLTDQFVLKGRRWFWGFALVVISLPLYAVVSWDGKVLVSLLGALVLALGWCLVAGWRRLEGARLAIAGVAGCLLILLWQPWQFLDRNLYLGLALLLALLLASHGRSVRATQLEAESAKLRTARLEIELLKRQLQPHFLMNTLTALSEWVEEDPATAVRMIEALADELRILVRVAEKQSIPLEEELRLCRSHLAVMGLRKDCAYRLEVELEEPGAQVPPAVIHTLVENAVTHGEAAADNVFRLWQRREEGWLRYGFQAPLAVREEAEPSRSEGTGLRYVRARLTECFGDRWKLEHGPWKSVWQTELVLPVDDL